jgi:hypothetical protein
MDNRIAEFLSYHWFSYDIGDIDPSYDMLRYVCSRFELNTEQRYWLAYLYSTCYCGATVYYIYNEFPDFIGVDQGRLHRWWDTNKHKMLFQTDRLWVKSRNQFCDMVQSYSSWIGPERNQEAKFHILRGQTSIDTYKRCYEAAGNIFQMGRFSLFLYLEAVHVVTGYLIKPNGLDLQNAQSSRNGLCFVWGDDDMLCGHDYGRSILTQQEYDKLYVRWDNLMSLLRAQRPEARTDAWNVETTLCAYKKFHRGKRYPGYYLDRQHDEIEKMQRMNTPGGVNWEVLWQFRKECRDNRYLMECTGHNNRDVWRSNVQ